MLIQNKAAHEKCHCSAYRAHLLEIAAAQDSEKPLHPATLSRLPISSRNYTSNCFSFTVPGSINGPRQRAARQLSSFKAGDSGMRWAVKSQAKPLALQVHPRQQSFKMSPEITLYLTVLNAISRGFRESDSRDKSRARQSHELLPPGAAGRQAVGLPSWEP